MSVIFNLKKENFFAVTQDYIAEKISEVSTRYPNNLVLQLYEEIVILKRNPMQVGLNVRLRGLIVRLQI